jgi:hypothetical protein
MACRAAVRDDSVVSDPTQSAWEAWWRARGEEELRLILWAAWDPIGDVPRDEYEDYAPRIASLLQSGAGPDMVAAALSEIRTGTIGLPPDASADLAVALKLRDWYEHPFPGTAYPSPIDFTS